MISDHPLIHLASDPSASARAALVSATTSHFLDNCEAGTPQECALFADIVTRLYTFAHIDIRKKLSAALAFADWAPQHLLRTLALDDIGIAEPIIALSPIIDNEILIEIVEHGSLSHQICVADRPNISADVSAKLITTQIPEVVAVLAKNVTARIGLEDFQRALEILTDNQGDLDALIARHDLPQPLVATAYALAGETTKRLVAARVSPKLRARIEALTEFVSQTTPQVQDHAWGLSHRHHRSDKADALLDRTLPTPGSLVAALMRGERDAFVRGLSRVLLMPQTQIHRQLAKPQPEVLALLARAAHFDLSLVRTLHDILDPHQSPWTTAMERGITLTWMRHSPTTARQALLAHVAH